MTWGRCEFNAPLPLPEADVAGSHTHNYIYSASRLLHHATCRHSGTVRVGEFVILCNFFVVDMDESPYVTIILGRLFLATAGAEIDV